MSITSIKNFSNELFDEIFDYLDGYHIYRAFSNLNHRFQRLVNDPCLLLKIKHCSSKPGKIFLNNWKQMMCLNRQQIYSIDFCMSSYIKKFFSSSFLIDSSLNHLESIVFGELNSEILVSVLIKLTSLPRLFSLTMHMPDGLENPNEIYRLLFNLPMLKYYKFTRGDPYLSVSLPLATNEQISSIEHLDIEHYFNLNELSIITSYTPQLRHLRFMHELDGDQNLNGIIPSMTLSNLTYLSIYESNLTFDTFQIFIRKICSKLKTLCVITQSQDINYLDANRWEYFILKYLPQLKNFRLEYDERIDDDFVFPIYPGELNQFTSSFWIQRKWLLETKIDDEHIKYSIRPFRYITKSAFDMK